MRRSFVVSLVTLSLLVGAVSAAGAKAPRASGNGPAAYCNSVLDEQTSPVTGETFDAYIVLVAFPFAPDPVPFPLSSFQACVSTVAGSMVDGVVPASEISTPAYLAQCDLLEAAGIVSYPYDFYDRYPAENRADCVKILKGVHSGELEGSPPGE